MTNARRAWRRLWRNPIAVIGGLMVISVILAAIFAPYFAPFPRHAGAVVDFRHRHLPPDATYWMGTDNAGRDILSRVLFGYRVSLLLVFGVLGVAMPLGVALGMAAGYFGGKIEVAIMRLTDIMLAMRVLNPKCHVVLHPNGAEVGQFRWSQVGTRGAVCVGGISYRKRQSHVLHALEGTGIDCDMVGPIDHEEFCVGRADRTLICVRMSAAEIASV